MIFSFSFSLEIYGRDIYLGSTVEQDALKENQVAHQENQAGLVREEIRHKAASNLSLSNLL